MARTIMTELTGTIRLRQIKGSAFIKSIVSGLVAGFIMFIVTSMGISSGMAPFDIPPSAALLVSIGLTPQPYALIIHFVYGTIWSVVSVSLFKDKMTTSKGVIVAFALWLFMMIVYSPVIGWGFFGMSGESGLSLMLLLDSTPEFILLTLLNHLIYGAVMGWMNASWLREKDGILK